MTIINDKQCKKAYKWENINIRPFDTNNVPFNQVKPIVDFVWKNEGLFHPPTVELLPSQCTRKAGCANRLVVRLKPTTYNWIILHELAHSMTSDFEGNSNWHGSLWMGVYIHLVSVYLKLDYDKLKKSAKDFGLAVSDSRKAIFV
jgi:hypothetical protein